MQERVDALETHISRVFFSFDRVYKLLKPVALSFVDFTGTEDRLAAARREYELNRRLAPDVYLGLADVHERGELVDHMIVMARMPADARLSEVVRGPHSSRCVRSVAREVARFHAGLEPLRDPEGPASADALASRWADNFDTIAGSVPQIISAEDFARARSLVDAYLDANVALFEARIADGYMRDGHGDLTAEDIFCLDDGPRILDCLAFRDDFRVGDVLADIAFLVMDVHRLAGAELARSLLRSYQQFSNERHPASLAHHYVAYRAHVRAKIACIRAGDGVPGQVELARSYHDLTLHHLERGGVHMIMIGGAPGVGKSTLADEVGRHFGWAVLMTDEVRKGLAGLPRNASAAAPLGEGIYSAEMTDRAYAELLREADLLLDRGESVVLDATFTHERHRAEARLLAERHGVDTIEIECTLDAAATRHRIVERSRSEGHASDATATIAEELAARRAPWPTAVEVSTAGTIGDASERLRVVLIDALHGASAASA